MNMEDDCFWCLVMIVLDILLSQEVNSFHESGRILCNFLLEIPHFLERLLNKSLKFQGKVVIDPN